MIKDSIKAIIKYLFQMVIWVYLLSCSWEGTTLFTRVGEFIQAESVAKVIESYVQKSYEQVHQKAQWPTIKVGTSEDLRQH